MLFQTFDDKKDCLGLYTNSKIYIKKLPKTDLTHTWEYSESLDIENVEYAKYYCDGKKLSEVCPEHLRSEWKTTERRLRAFYRAAQESALDLNEHCYFDMLPKYILLDYGKIKNKISSHVFQNYPKPSDYDFRVKLAKILIEIKNTKLNIDTLTLEKRQHEYKVRKFIKKIKKTPPYISYNMYGTKTGRLTSKQFPILTLDKSYRSMLKPNNSWFLEMDYNAAELRVMIGLLDKKQPREDIHNWNLNNVFKKVGTREEVKKRVFAWLYNPKSQDSLLNKAYDRDSVLQKYYNGSQVTTFFDRTIETDDHHALNYIIQSTASDLFLRQMIKVWEHLRDKKSNIAFCLHDSLIIDLHSEDENMIHEIKEIFAKTELGTFRVNVSGGKDFGNMKAMNVR